MNTNNFIDQLEFKLLTGANAAAGAFLSHNGFRIPTASERMEFNRLALPAIMKLVADAAPTADSPLEVFEKLIALTASFAVKSIVVVMKLGVLDRPAAQA
ncbi:MAG: hypothetical protein DI536_14125 [Archangium gephyra]|uniref:Uncharacterized protein n=1 Tax=Archangium gephyra TaxID=48 RepID=A0A2W5TB52_9BACT|nr:MAG: hypothetical protein DI536_14125 [Archangium gephyra]